MACEDVETRPANINQHTSLQDNMNRDRTRLMEQQRHHINLGTHILSDVKRCRQEPLKEADSCKDAAHQQLCCQSQQLWLAVQCHLQVKPTHQYNTDKDQSQASCAHDEGAFPAPHEHALNKAGKISHHQPCLIVMI